MNQEKIGQFISECRKEKKMTQTELAEKLGVSDKTISNWENARCMPDLSLYKPLCEILDITINDLISGEKVSSESYQEKLEENIIETINYTTKKALNKDKIIAEILFVCGLAIIFIAFTIFPSESSWGSIFSIIGTIVSLIGVIKFNKISNNILRIVINIGYFIVALFLLLLLDYTNVALNHTAPRFSYLKEATNNMIIYKAPFYNVYRVNFDTKNEYYIIDTKREYKNETVPNVPFNYNKTNINNLMKYKNEYVGNNSNTGNLISNLPISEYGYVFEIDSENLNLTINYHVTHWYIMEDYNLYLEKCLMYNAISIFYLIDNVESITFNFTAASYKITREQVEGIYPNFKNIKDNDSFNLYLENKIMDDTFIDYYFDKLFKENTK